MKYDEFKKKYREEHCMCPSCHTKNYTQTLVGYLYDENHPEDYMDRNSVKCNICGWKGIVHELIPKPEKIGYKICYWDQLNRTHNYNETIYDTKEEAKIVCEELNNKYKKYVNVDFYTYEIDKLKNT